LLVALSEVFLSMLNLDRINHDKIDIVQ